MLIGYTTGVFDLFHIGHLNILRTASTLCDKLIVGANIASRGCQYKKRYPVIPFIDRVAIVRSINYVDEAIKREIFDKVEEWKHLKFDIIFVGDDWYGDEKWMEWQAKLLKVNVKIIYLPHTSVWTTSEIKNKIVNDYLQYNKKNKESR